MSENLTPEMRAALVPARLDRPDEPFAWWAPYLVFVLFPTVLYALWSFGGVLHLIGMGGWLIVFAAATWTAVLVSLYCRPRRAGS